MHVILRENYYNFQKNVHDLNDRTHFGEQILFERKLSIFNFVLVGRRRRKSNFQNFRKFRVNRENETYAIFIGVFYFILTKN